MPNLNYGVENIDITDVKSDVNDYVNLKEKIKAAINNAPKITQRALVGKIGVSFRQIQQNMSEMVSSGEIIRIGSNRSGYWKVLK